MTDIFQGDPKLILDENGVDLVITGGQPLMDQGLENHVLISLYSAPGWWGNDLMTDPAQELGSDFEDEVNGPITLENLNDTSRAAVEALEGDAFESVEAETINPRSWQKLVRILVTRPGGDPAAITATKYGTLWDSQTLDPTYKKL